MSEVSPALSEAPVALPNPASVPNVPPAVVEQAKKDAPETSPQSEAQPVKPDDQTEKPRQKASERIGEIYGRMKAAERRAEQLAAEVARLQRPAYDPNQYDQMPYDEQQRAQMRQAVREERAAELRSEAELQAREAAAARSAMFQDRVAEARAQIPDLDVIFSPNLPISDVGARFVAESDKGPQVAYWLAQNQQEAARIALLDPIAQGFELGRIEARLSVAPTVRKVSHAPAPVPTVGGGASPAGKDPANMSMSEYAEWRRKGGA